MADGNHSGWLGFDQELVIDLFAGGGGASLGLSQAYREPDIAVNHNEVAIAVHRANHPNTKHFTCDVFEVDPIATTGGRPVGVLWASPDCRHHSKAAGGKPRSAKIRGLAWVVIKWASACKPRLIHLENVEEFADWGPLLPDGRPDKSKKGLTFRRWKKQLENLGYAVECRELVAADYDTPTIRKRLYVIARCDGRPIVWPKAENSRTSGGGLPAWRPAAECIDFDLPTKSIFDRKKPLASNTQRRVAKGLWRYVLNCAEPFIVGCGGRMGQSPERSCTRPFQTITSKADACIAEPVFAPFLTEHANSSNQRTFSAEDPLRTQCAQVKGGHFSVVAAHLMHLTHHGDRRGLLPTEPLPTVTGANRGEQAMVSAFFEQANGGFYDGDGRAASAPISTICQSGANQRLVSAYLVKYYGEGGQWQACNEPMHTLPTKDRMGLVSVVQVASDTLAPEYRAKAKLCADLLHEYLPEHFPEPAEMVLVGDMVLVDITLRMLVPRELARAQGFPDSYIIERGLFEDPATGELYWKAITKTDQVRLIGNSVCWKVARALVRANAADLIALYRKVA